MRKYMKGSVGRVSISESIIDDDVDIDASVLQVK